VLGILHRIVAFNESSSVSSIPCIVRGCQGVVKGLLRGSQEVIRELPVTLCSHGVVGSQGVVRVLSRGCQCVVRVLSRRCQGMSGGCQGVVKSLSGCCQGVVKRLSGCCQGVASSTCVVSQA